MVDDKEAKKAQNGTKGDEDEEPVAEDEGDEDAAETAEKSGPAEAAAKAKEGQVPKESDLAEVDAQE